MVRGLSSHRRVRAEAGGDTVGSTTHIAVLDSEGNAASVTCSNGTGSGVLPPGTGLHLNNMLGEEDLNPLGFHLHKPGTRVTSMMAPTVVLRDGKVELALGSAGSNRLRSAITQVIRYVVDYGLDLEQAPDRRDSRQVEELLVHRVEQPAQRRDDEHEPLVQRPQRQHQHGRRERCRSDNESALGRL